MAAPLPGFRRDDLVTIRRAAGSADGELDWNRTDGIARPPSDELLVSLGAGDWVAYDFVVSSPSRFEIVVESKPMPAVSVDGTGLGVEGATEQLTAGRHVVRLTGLSDETIVRSIEVTPAAGR